MAAVLAALNDALATRTGRRLLRWVVVALLATSLVACVANGANGPADPHLASPSSIPGFGEVAFRVRPAGADRATSGERCALLAETETQRARGLMGRRDLAGYDGMIFRFPGDTTATFYMRNVPIPLSVAWFDAAGRFVSAADMAPCPDREGCPSYGAERPYRLALEVPGGGLARLDVGPGSAIELGRACPGG
jgi:uncharacterized membrane protein (UPF0127 family)